MKPPRYDSQQLAPLTTDALIEERVTALIGRAARRQVWFLFVDAQDDQLPLLMPWGDHPSRPRSGDADHFAALLAQVREAADASGVIVVIERYGSAELTKSDLAWANVLRGAALGSGMALRGVLLSHARGVRWVAPDDYLFADG